MVSLEKEFDFFLQHQSDFVKKYEGMFIVIKGHKVIGAHSNLKDAIREAEKKKRLEHF